MNRQIDCFIPWSDDSQCVLTKQALISDNNVANVLQLTESVGATKTIKYIAETASAPYVLLYTKYDTLQLGLHALDRMLTVTKDYDALMLYADHYIELPSGKRQPMPLIDYQVGSVRDDFQMGSLLLLKTEVLKRYISQPNLHRYHYAALYDLRLFLSREKLPVHRGGD